MYSDGICEYLLYCSSTNRIFVMKMVGCFLWCYVETFPFFAVTTSELPQEGRVETVNCLVDEGGVCVRVRVCVCVCVY